MHVILTIKTLNPFHVVRVSHRNNSTRPHRHDVFGMRVTSRVFDAIHFRISQPFAEEVLFFEAFLLALTVAESDVLVFCVNQSTLRIMFVGAQIVQELFISTIGNNLTLVLDVLVIHLGDSECIWLGVLVFATQNTTTEDVFVEDVGKSHASDVISLRNLERNRATLESSLEKTALNTLSSRHQLVDG